jgi:trigger factor
LKIDVEAIDKVRKKVEVILPEEKITELREAIYGDLKKKAKIKGFRPGKIPRAVISSYYKEYIEEELKKKAVESTMTQALSEAKVEPISEPVVDFIDEEGRFGYSLECEVLPEIELPEYKGIEVEAEPVSVTEEEIDKRIDGLRETHAQMQTREAGSVAEKGNFLVVSYQGYHDDKPMKDVKADAYPLELGATSLLPEFENTLYGMAAGEEKEATVNFPEDYPDKDIASKAILFKIALKEIREKIRPEVNDDFAKDLNFENMDALRQGMKKEIIKEKETARKQAIAQNLLDTLNKAVEVPVPKRMLEKRVESMLQDARQRLNMDRFPVAERVNLEANFRKEFEGRAEERIKSEILIFKIAAKEGITAEDGDVQGRMQKMAEETRRPYEDIKSFYEQYNLLGSLIESIVQEKTVSFLMDNAIIKEKA